MIAHKSNSVIGVVNCRQPHFGGPDGKPFFEAELDKSAAEALLAHIKSLAQSKARGWYFITSSSPDPTRLRITNLERIPAFESNAAEHYLRGDVFRVTGATNSCNINFSVPVGARLLAECIEDALGRTEKSLRIVIPNRHKQRNLVEFIPDVDQPQPTPDEHEALGAIGEAAAAQALAAEDFSDWE